MNANTGVNFTQFSNIIDKYGDTVIVSFNSTRYDNLSGHEVFTVSSTASVTAYIVRKNRPWQFDKAGEIEGGDAVMLVKPDQTINKNDVVTWNSNDYYVETVLNRDQIGGNVAYKACNLFLK